ncbi:C-3 sterol dehydrogenase/C-4 decarboxylase family protein [Metarhizium album ARSEF 1941]|uniref:C-3 sterol dehydrogenase/C-4 decarboxylase family protein n=1 Tax=Metarhizium album (strain ARSEF 1941) TaxID=1081103 RepID=A0A0B2WWF3_METAS|nr:C-3 sterol dehydrogenase/C-4 decarboxylase family protein [Metarhizium album ARSEF 1941]KHN98388.1 C-3 sterol dehydrogenase/C-4 decarboxylase family protein [Metarhizium album ARSEF 1941]
MSPQTPSPRAPRDTALVLGGCGFLGWHLVARLLACREYDGGVYVLDRNTRVNLHDGATYIQGDLTQESALRAVLDQARPSVVFHAASPVASLPARMVGEFVKTNVDGTKVVIELATESASVKALVYTSTVDVYANPPHENVSEDDALWSPSDRSNEYNRTKAMADHLVRAANGPRLRTASLRLGHAYGERQSQGLAEMLDSCGGTKPLIQIGNGANMMEVVSAENCALGHVLVARALLGDGRGDGRVAGEAFNISDGAPVPFWHHVRVVWRACRGDEALNSVIVLPAWVMVVAVAVVEWVLWLSTLDTVKPPTVLRRTALEYCIYNHTYTIGKARQRLGFRPVADHDAVLTRAVRLMLAERAELAKAESVESLRKRT